MRSVTLTTTRNAIVVFGEGYGVLLVPVQRRIKMSGFFFNHLTKL